MEKKIKKSEFARTKTKRSVAPREMLKTRRDLQGLSQNQLAELTGISPSNISAMESGSRKIGRERAITFAKALKVHPALNLFSDFDINAVA